MCVHLSVIPSVLPFVQSCPRNSSYVFHPTDLKFIDCLHVIWRCVCGFWFLFPPFLMKLWPLLSQTLSPQLLHIFYQIDLKLCWMFHHDLKTCMWFWIFSFLIFDKVMALCHFWHFSNFWTIRAKLNFGELLVFDILIILIMVRIC